MDTVTQQQRTSFSQGEDEVFCACKSDSDARVCIIVGTSLYLHSKRR